MLFLSIISIVINNHVHIFIFTMYVHWIFFWGGKKNLGNLPVAQAEEPVSPRRVVATSAWMMGMSTGQEFPPDGK